MANWLTKVLPWSKKAAEGAYRPGPYVLNDGWLSASAGRLLNFWQAGYNVQPYGECSAMVEACVSAYAQTIAMCPGDHWVTNPDGGVKAVTTSALSRILRRPNSYQSPSDLMMNMTRRLYTYGEAFALVLRNARTEVEEIHLMPQGSVRIGEDGSIFYDLSGNEIIESRFGGSLMAVPARDVLHVRLWTPRHVLKGVSPILSTALDMALSGAALNQQVSYYLNEARPSYVIETSEKFTAEQTKQLRDQWDATTRGEGYGGTPILSWGLTAKKMPGGSQDGKLAEMLKLSDDNIAKAFRIPPAVLGVGGQTFASTEALMAAWKATGLGFALNHIEEAFGLLFGLKGWPAEFVAFDTDAFMRSAYRERIEGLARGVISGIYSPDEARAYEGLPAVPDGAGAEPRVQMQVVPLSFGQNMEAPDPNAAPAAPPKPANDDAQAAAFDSGEYDERGADELAQQFEARFFAHLERG